MVCHTQASAWWSLCSPTPTKVQSCVGGVREKIRGGWGLSAIHSQGIVLWEGGPSVGEADAIVATD